MWLSLRGQRARPKCLLSRGQTSDHPACVVWQEVAELAKEMPDHPIIPKLAQIQAICQDQEYSGVAGAVHNRLDHLGELDQRHPRSLELHQ